MGTPRADAPKQDDDGDSDFAGDTVLLTEPEVEGGQAGKRQSSALPPPSLDLVAEPERSSVVPLPWRPSARQQDGAI